MLLSQIFANNQTTDANNIHSSLFLYLPPILLFLKKNKPWLHNYYFSFYFTSSLLFPFLEYFGHFCLCEYFRTPHLSCSFVFCSDVDCCVCFWMLRAVALRCVAMMLPAAVRGVTMVGTMRRPWHCDMLRPWWPWCCDDASAMALR